MSEQTERAIPSKALRRVLCAAAMGVALALGACMGTAPPPPQAQQPADPALAGHREWCGTNPPSGYCDVEFKH